MTDEMSVMVLNYVPFVAAVSVVAFGLLGAGCSEGAAQSAPAAPGTVVELADVTRAEAVYFLPSQGTLARRDEARLAFKIGGIVERVSVRAGDRVMAGQVLARLDSVEIDAEVARAESLKEEAKRGMERAERLVLDGVVSKERAEDARTRFETALAALEIARFNRRFSEIVAPSDGWVLERLSEPGELLPAGRAVVRFAPMSSGWVVRAAVADRVADRLKVGARAKGSDSVGREFSATLDRIEGAAQEGTRLAKLEWLVEGDTPEEWRSGAVVDLEMEVQSAANLIRIPASAVVSAGADSVEVFHAEALNGAECRVRREHLRMQRIDGDVLIVTGPLVPGDRVVTAGASWLKEGDVVLVAERDNR